MFKAVLMRSVAFVIFAVGTFNSAARAKNSVVQDTLLLDFTRAKQIFLDSNLQLLAAYYDIQSANELVKQARKWDNPNLITDQNVYTNKKYFAHGKDASGVETGQVFVQVQQIIKTAGKRRILTDIAVINAGIATWQFRGIMSDLKVALAHEFYSLYHYLSVKQLLIENLDRLNILQDAMNGQLNNGNIARKEYLRVQALIIGLRQELATNETYLINSESELRTLLRLPATVIIKPLVYENVVNDSLSITYVTLADSAIKNNADYNIEMQQLAFARRNLSLQKALAVPDLTIAPEYDQSSSYVSNYYGLTFSLPIPLLDRNRRNIKSADFRLKGEMAKERQAYLKLDNNLFAATKKMLQLQRLSAQLNKAFYDNYLNLYTNIVESYNKRQISMIEFLDFFDSYKDVMKNRSEQFMNLQVAREELNAVAGCEILH